MPSKKTITEISNIALQDSQLVFQWINTHNLKDIDLTLPKNKIITITGVSGSGKSSLAFDTIYKEWQFRYIESLSSYLRQFFNLGERPDINFCSWLSPAIAIEQNKRAWNSRSTVGTLTEIDDYLRLLFAKLGNIYCHGCGKEIKPQSVDDIMSDIKKKFLKKKIFLLQESWSFKEQVNLIKFVKNNRNKIDKGLWFTRYLLVPNEEIQKTVDPIEYFYLETPNIPEKYFPIKCYGIYDRVTVEQKKIARLKEDIIKILSETNKFWVFLVDDNFTWNSSQILWFTDKMYCADCNIKYPEFSPQSFSPNRQEWACLNCHGLWEVLQVDFDKLIDPESPYLKAILPRRDSAYGQAVIKKIAYKYEIDENILWKDIPDRFQHIVLYGDSEILRLNMWWKYVSLKYEGVENIIKEQYAKWLLTVDFQAMLDMKSCPDCNWAKLRKESLYVSLVIDKKKIQKTNKLLKKTFFIDQSILDEKREYSKIQDDKKIHINIRDLHNMQLKELVEFLQVFLKYSPKDKILIERITQPLLDRASTIEQLGLWYITLHRKIWTLSGGEVQRLRLAKQLWNKLTWIIYVLDEPTIWLSDKEISKAIDSIKRLKNIWNTVIVVEHNEDFIKNSDRVVEIGPQAGDFWWNIVFNGPYSEFLKSDCLTAQYILWKKQVNINFEHRPSEKIVSIKKAEKYNLKKIDVNIKLGSFTVITWPSGSWKTTLMYTTLYRFLNEKDKFIQWYIRFQLLKLGWDWQKIITAPVMNKEQYEHYRNLALQGFYDELWVDTIRWYEEIKNTIYVDQWSIGKTPRSCPSTFIWVFDKIRQLFAGTTQAKYLGFTAGHFSFNSKKWACPACNGYGYKKVELQFLPDTYIPCDMCRWKRYKQEILDIKRHWKNISEILAMYVDEAAKFFTDIWHIYDQLELLLDIGLGYLKMGQPAHMLSGGESQRLKLVKHLLKSYKGHTVYFLDEPTVGLHFADIEKLLQVLKKFLDNWDTVLMIEHDKSILQFADNIIHLDDGNLIS